MSPKFLLETLLSWRTHHHSENSLASICFPVTSHYEAPGRLPESHYSGGRGTRKWVIHNLFKVKCLLKCRVDDFCTLPTSVKDGAQVAPTLWRSQFSCPYSVYALRPSSSWAIGSRFYDVSDTLLLPHLEGKDKTSHRKMLRVGKTSCAELEVAASHWYSGSQWMKWGFCSWESPRLNLHVQLTLLNTVISLKSRPPENKCHRSKPSRYRNTAKLSKHSSSHTCMNMS